MAFSPHAFVRGNTAQFYEWLDRSRMPRGPSVWICGDCHVGNLGPVADADGNVEIEIRDLDHTAIGDPCFDLVRLGLSLATIARSSNLLGEQTFTMVDALLGGYVRGLRRPSIANPPPAVGMLLESSLRRSWHRMLEERIEDLEPVIPIGRYFWPLTARERAQLGALASRAEIEMLVRRVASRDDDARVRLLDAAYWMKGCSSLGRLRFALLLRAGKHTKVERGRLCLLDVKEAHRSLVPDARTETRNHAERVVKGARALSPFLGTRMHAGRVLDTPVFVRELLPQDLKLCIERMRGDEATAVAAYLGTVIGRAHGRQLDPGVRRDWSDQVSHKRRSQRSQWLWSSVVGQLGRHEAAYLEHCRDHALRRKRA